MSPDSGYAQFLLAQPPRHLAGSMETHPDNLAGQAGLVIPGTKGASALRKAGFKTTTCLALPDASSPAIVVPVGFRSALRSLMRDLSATAPAAKRLRNRALAELLPRGVVPPTLPVLTIAARAWGAPFLVRAAGERMNLKVAEWMALFGSGDDLARSAFLLFPKDERDPAFALKFARIPGLVEPFDQDERGLEVAKSNPVLAERSPKLLARFDTAGLHASVETAAVGNKLIAELTGAGSRASKLRPVKRIVDWLIEAAGYPSGSADDLRTEIIRLEDGVFSKLPRGGAGAARALDGLLPVAQHNDLGSWNIFVREDSFTAVDWESARLHALPLWDLLYFLCDALAIIDGAESVAEKEDHFVELSQGSLDSSRLYFESIDRYVRRSVIPNSSVGALATTCWLHHGESERGRKARLAEFEIGEAWPNPSRGRASRWLQEEGLGPQWAAFDSAARR